MSKLFTAISALKSAYVQLQRAHIPYEPRKIQDADELIVSELDSISRLEEVFYNGEQRRKAKSLFSLCQEIREHEQLILELQSRNQAKESDVLQLRQVVEELDQNYAELEKEVKKKMPPKYDISLFNQEWTPSVFFDAFKLTSKAIHDFTKPLISLMKASGWNLDQAADSIENQAIYTERCHKKFAFEAYVSRVMFSRNRSEWFKLDHFDRVLRFSNPFDALIEDPDSNFGKFCRYKYVLLVKSKMESSLFGNLDQREFVLRGGHPRTPFYQAFVRMAIWVWALQVMAHSFIPKADVFYAKRGSRFEEEYMESVVDSATDRGEQKVEVGFTVMPGFKIGNNVIRCRVYPCKM
ncbi:uncharacterized protein LOC109830047 isoform X2 [Asparagus officinalis]|nr:uncharacterized protein LOC109830047 isoform X2 [Asparagus officinalis]